MRQPVLSRMLGSYIDDLLDDFSYKILESVQTMEWKGKLRMFIPGFFTCIQVSDEFAIKATQILSTSGFELSPLMEKQNSPRTHISVMNSTERRQVPQWRAHQVRRKWQNCEIPFLIENVQMWVHTSNETQERKLLCCLKIKSELIKIIRVDLGCEPSSTHYNMHMVVSEKSIE